jgi:hypothetical protein
MKGDSMKRTMIGLLIGGAIFAGVYGFADSLNITSNTLGAGSSVVAACQTATINVSYTASYSSSAPGYVATTVTLNNLDETAGHCGGATAKVTLTGPGGSNASLGEQSATLSTGSGTTQNLTFTGVKASDVTGVHVLIS